MEKYPSGEPEEKAKEQQKEETVTVSKTKIWKGVSGVFQSIRSLSGV